LLSSVVRIESGGRGEDRAAVRGDGERLIVVVADGAGGTGAGAMAAQAVCDAVLMAWSSERAWDEVLRAVDLRLSRAADGGQSTAVVVEVTNQAIRGASVGDSAAWLVGQSEVLDLTEHQRRKPLLGNGNAEATSFGPVPFTGRLLVASDGLFKHARSSEVRRRAWLGTLDESALALVDGVRLRSGRLPDDVAVALVEWKDAP
jgi:serine/threonine protein phosphatase PrpC